MKNAARIALGVSIGLLAAAAARADEGMWTFDDVPAARVERSLGVRIERPWLDHLRDTSVRLSSGCSAAVVSRQGLLLTNHHCVLPCEQSLSGASDVISEGFIIDSRTAERVCPGLQAEVLEAIGDVTNAIFASSAGKYGDEYVKARQDAIARAERDACGGDARLRCQVISFYGGGLFKVYRFRRFDDVRLVFAPEFAIAFFGGDADNFSFPRLDLDCAFLRVYVNGRPAATPDFLAWTQGPPKADEAVFIAGSPATTERNFTVSQLETQRDVVLPINEKQHADLRDRLLAFARRDADHRRIVAEPLFDVENDLKVIRGRIAALNDAGFMAARERDEQSLKARLAVDGALVAQIADPWADMARIDANYVDNYIVWRELENAAGAGSQMFAWARALVRGADERAKPTGLRLPEFADSRLPLMRKWLLDDKPVSAELETLYLEFWLTNLRDGVGAQFPATQGFLNGETPAALAKRLMMASRLNDAKVRRALWDGGQAAIQQSGDPLIAFVERTDPLSRAARRLWEDDVQGPTQGASERIARVRFLVGGPDVYPDATFSPRLSYGKVEGWVEGGSRIGPFTSLGQLYGRATGVDPYRLPQRWLAARDHLSLGTVLDFTTTNDIIGGSSGSPVVDARGDIVGTVFDGNHASILGDFAYEGAENRTVALSTAAITEALAKVYGRANLVRELTGR